MKHTDGDWFVSGQTEVVSMPSQCKIAKVSGWNYEQAEANAKLIAAAPEMYNALESIITYWHTPQNTRFSMSDHLEHIFKIAEKALKNAT